LPSSPDPGIAVFNRSTLLILMAALAAGLGLWAAQVHFGNPHARPAASARTMASDAVDPARLATVRLYPQVRALPPFELQQSDGTTLTADELHGRWTLVFLGFTHCPDVCPTTLSDLAQAQKAWADLPEATRPRVLFVSVDPERDTPAKTGEYAAFFHPDTLAATAPVPALEAFAASLGLVFMKVGTAAGDYSMDHSVGLVLIDPLGRQAGLVRPPLRPADIAADLRLLTESGR
jgi:protein SCO1/2